jgi:hypothetical protein
MRKRMPGPTLMGVPILGIILVAALVVGIQTWNEMDTEDPIKLQTIISFEYDGDAGGTLTETFRWSALDFSDLQGNPEIQWKQQFVHCDAVLSTSVDLLLNEYFSTMTLEKNKLTLFTNGQWLLHLEYDLGSNIALNINISGVNNTILDINPYADFSLIPQTLRNSLNEFGISIVQVRASIDFRILVEFLQRFISKWIQIAQAAVGWISKQIECLLDTIIV